MQHIGLIGLGTMGASLARNAARNGATVAVYNRTPDKVDTFMTAHGKEGHFIPCKTLPELTAALPGLRTIVLMVSAGEAIDAIIRDLTPLLSPGDLIIDAGNSHYLDSGRREKSLATSGILFLGLGVSGGEEGALTGPSMMAGGSRDAFDRVSPLLLKMAASDGSRGTCLAYFGSGGAGHFVKMVHNGIEYADMQLIAETYHILRNLLALPNAAIAATFEAWNKRRDLQSFLIDITAEIFRTKDDLGSGGGLIDLVKSEAKQKGTGTWTVQASLDLGVPVPTIAAGVAARSFSTLRSPLQGTFGSLQCRAGKLSVNLVRDALLTAKIMAYAEGFALIERGNAQFSWLIHPSDVARVWRGGCIIRSSLLKTFEAAFRAEPRISHLLQAPAIALLIQKKHMKLRKVASVAVNAGIPLPAMSAALAGFDILRSGWLPQNLTQAQRDSFGAHTFERTDREGTFHVEWKNLQTQK